MMFHPIYLEHIIYEIDLNSRLARFLRQSFRHSVRRLREMTTPTSPPPPPPSSSSVNPAHLHLGLARLKSADDSLPPPDYATVTIETERHLAASNSSMQESTQELLDTFIQSDSSALRPGSDPDSSAWLIGIWHKWLSKLVDHPNQCQPNPGLTADESPCNSFTIGKNGFLSFQ